MVKLARRGSVTNKASLSSFFVTWLWRVDLGPAVRSCVLSAGDLGIEGLNSTIIDGTQGFSFVTLNAFISYCTSIQHMLQHNMALTIPTQA